MSWRKIREELRARNGLLLLFVHSSVYKSQLHEESLSPDHKVHHQSDLMFTITDVTGSTHNGQSERSKTRKCHQPGHNEDSPEESFQMRPGQTSSCLQFIVGDTSWSYSALIGHWLVVSCWILNRKHQNTLIFQTRTSEVQLSWI